MSDFLLIFVFQVTLLEQWFYFAASSDLKKGLFLICGLKVNTESNKASKFKAACFLADQGWFLRF